MKLKTVERLCLASALSISVLFYNSFLIFSLKLPDWSHLISFSISILLSVKYLSDSSVKLKLNKIYSHGILAALVFLYPLYLLSLTRNFCGGGWYGDWYEHYERSIFFSKNLPLNTIFLGAYILPARPPLMHLTLSPFLKLEDEFSFYQILSLILNSLSILAGLLFVQDEGKLKSENKTASYIFIILALITPSLIQSLIYGWPRPLTYFFVLVGIYEYLCYQNSKCYRHYSSISCLTLATLTHYSAAPYLIVILIHSAFRVLIIHSYKELRSFLECIFIVLLLFTPWLAWSINKYGLSSTFLSNSTIMESNSLTLTENVYKIILNIRDTLIPHFLRDISWNFGPLGSLEYWENFFFLIYQPNLIFAFGSLNFLVIIFIIFTGFSKNEPKRLVVFWISFLSLIIPLSIAVIGGRDHFGLAHIGLHPIVILGLCLIARNFSKLPKCLKYIFGIGLVADFLIGTAIHFYLQNTFTGNSNYNLKITKDLIFYGDHINYHFVIALIFTILIILMNKLAKER